MSQPFDLFVIGAGSGGVRAARIAAGLGAHVGICEERYFGGTCVNVGCVPKKLFALGSRFAAQTVDAGPFGWDASPPRPAFERMVENVGAEVQRLEGIYRRLLDRVGVETMDGRGTVLGPTTVEVAGRRVEARNILVATGGWPLVPAVDGAELAITSNEVFSLSRQPARIAVVGGGYIALEMASIFAGYGSAVTVIHRGEALLRGFDTDVRHFIAGELSSAGIALRLQTEVAGLTRKDAGIRVELSAGDSLEVDEVLMATGRTPNTANLGLEEAGVTLDAQGYIRVDADYRTSTPTIFAVGDVVGHVQLTPVALAEGMAVAHHLFGAGRAVASRNIPTAVFCTPEIASVGLTEAEARDELADVTIFKESFRPLRHSVSGRQTRTMMKLVVDTATDKVVGVHIVGEAAAEMIQGFAVALQCGATKAAFDGTIGLHPTSAEELVTMRTPMPEPGVEQL